MKGNPQQFVVDPPPRDQPLNVVVAWIVRQFQALAKTRQPMLQEYADDTAAAAAGVPLGGMYHTAGAVRVRLT